MLLVPSIHDKASGLTNAFGYTGIREQPFLSIFGWCWAFKLPLLVEIWTLGSGFFGRS